MADLVCPTCGPTATEPHPRRRGVMRCTNCKEWLTPLGPHAPNCTDPDDHHRGVCRTDRRTQSPAGVDAPGGHVAPAGTPVVGASVGAS